MYNTMYIIYSIYYCYKYNQSRCKYRKIMCMFCTKSGTFQTLLTKRRKTLDLVSRIVV